jgi:hypothetical protein
MAPGLVDERWRLEGPPMWEWFLGWEVEVCAQPAAVDGGTHMIAVARARD